MCIDDESIDNSWEILEDYAENDKERMKVKIFMENTNNKKKVYKGTSGARNAGIDIASGEYITFVNPDDYVHPNC